jgi:hypothetical protein
VSYVILPHVATGDLATAALHNTLLDDIAIIKSNINDDGFLNPIKREIAAKGTFSGTTITTVSSVALSGLTDQDYLECHWGVRAGTGFTTGSVQLRSSTDNLQLFDGNNGINLGVNENIGGYARLSQSQEGNTKMHVWGSFAGDLHPSTGWTFQIKTLTTPWTSAWTLAFALTQTSGSALWWWYVTRRAGQ